MTFIDYSTNDCLCFIIMANVVRCLYIVMITIFILIRAPLTINYFPGCCLLLEIAMALDTQVRSSPRD